MTAEDKKVLVKEVIAIFSDTKGVYRMAVRARVKNRARQLGEDLDEKAVNAMAAEICFELTHLGLDVVHQ